MSDEQAWVVSARCGKCGMPAVAVATCDAIRDAGMLKGKPCGLTYGRCDEHGGERGARRSLKSHKGLNHPVSK
jgi:hypothetical protein